MVLYCFLYERVVVDVLFFVCFGFCVSVVCVRHFGSMIERVRTFHVRMYQLPTLSWNPDRVEVWNEQNRQFSDLVIFLRYSGTVVQLFLSSSTFAR